MKSFYTKEISYFLQLIGIIILFFTVNYSSAQTYCNFGGYANPGAGWSNYITNVTITGGGINNTSAGTDGSYQDYTGNTDGTVTKGSSYSSSVTYNKSAWTTYLGVYIDWNDDGDFSDANEVIVNNASLQAGSGSGTYSFTINVPTGAATSTVRMRVYNNSNAGACAYAYGEAEDYEIVVSGVSNPTAEAGSNQTICNGNSTSLSATASGGTSPYSYAWSASTGTNPSATANPSVTPTVTTTYTLTVTDNNSATATDNVVITVNSLPTANAGSDIAICTSSSTNLTATGGSSYAWNTSATTASISVSPTSTSTFTVTVTTNNCTASDNVVVTVNALPTAEAGNNVSICSGASTNITATGGGSYAWSNSATTAIINVSPTTTTTYSVTVTTNSCTASDNVVLTVNSIPTANAGSDATICFGSSINLTATGGASYVWNTNATTANISVSPTSITTYTVTVTSNSCTASDNVVVTTNGNLSLTGATRCGAGEVTLTVNSTGGPFYWYTQATGGTAVHTGATYTPTVTSTTTYFVGESNSTTTNGHVGITVEPTYSSQVWDGYTRVFPTSSNTMNFTTSQANVTLSSVDIWTGSQTTGSYLTDFWVTIEDNSSTVLFTSSHYTILNTDPKNKSVPLNVTLSSAGQYKMRIYCSAQADAWGQFGFGGFSFPMSDANNIITLNNGFDVFTNLQFQTTSGTSSCQRDSVVAIVNTQPTANAGSDIIICGGSSANLTASGGSLYAWNTNDTTSSISVSPTTTINTYIVTVTTNNCTASDAVMVFVNTQPTANVGSDLAICTGDSTNLTATGLGTTYLWSTSDTTATINVSPSLTTTYTVLIANNTCTATDDVIVTVNPLPIINRDSLLTQYISGRTLAVGGTPPYTYVWSPVLTDWMTIFTTSNTISLTITDANQCSASDSVSINPNTTPNIQSCSELFISEYIQDTSSSNNAIELYNPTDTIIDLSNYYIMQTTNGSIYSPTLMIKLRGTIDAYKTFVIANSYADSSLKNKANMLSDSLIFNGKDVVALTYISGGTSNLQMIDKIGDLMTAYTDSGWAVGLGSTKNHTLIRYGSIDRGNSNWLTCKSEWTVFSQGTFDSLGTFMNVCTPIDPYLYLTIVEKEKKCLYPKSYYEFNVLAHCSAPDITYLSSSSVKITYTSGGVIGDNFRGVEVFNGTDYPDFYKSISYPTSSSFVISFGNNSYLPSSSENKQISSSTSRVLFTVRIPIISCSGTSTLTIVADPTNSYYRKTELELGPETRDTIHNWEYVSDIIPCSGCPSTGCPDPCYGPSHLVDNYTLGVPYNQTITKYYYRKYDNDIVSGNLSVSSCPLNIESHTDSVYPGTHAGDDILTIKGSGFGKKTTKAFVTVADADGSPNDFNLDNKDYIYWHENEIKIRIPSVMSSPRQDLTPGSGKFHLFNDCDETDNKPLIICYSLMNKQKDTLISGNTFHLKERYNIVKANDSIGSLIFRCDTSVYHNKQAYACVKKAIDIWNCNTGVNWTLGDTIALSTSKRDSLSNNLINDGISYIYFSDLFNISNPDILMSTKVYPGLSCNDTVNAFMNKANIKIKRNLSNVSGSPTWCFNDSTNIVSGNIVYFYDAILHELGHAHLLNHINDTSDLMYYSSSRKKRERIRPQDYLCGMTIINLSKNVTSCSPYQPIESNGHECNLSVPIIEKKVNNLNVYPNPVGREDVTISYLLTKNAEVQFLIMDYTGKNVLTLNKGKEVAGKYTEQVNISQFSKGVYLIIANINGEHQTIKLIKQ